MSERIVLRKRWLALSELAGEWCCPACGRFPEQTHSDKGHYTNMSQWGCMCWPCFYACAVPNSRLFNVAIEWRDAWEKRHHGGG